MRAAGHVVDVKASGALDRIRQGVGVPDELAGCHTSMIGDLVVEGHVPAAAVARLLAARDRWFGLAVAGMPLGSPGMEVAGQPAEVYPIWALRRDGPPVLLARARGGALLPEDGPPAAAAP